MKDSRSTILNLLSRQAYTRIPVYCTGYPDDLFIDQYKNEYSIKEENRELMLANKDYDPIIQMGFDAISIWDLRAERTYEPLPNGMRLDCWGRVYKHDWYTWDGVFKSEKIMADWDLLSLPTEEKFMELKEFIRAAKDKICPILSIPGLFEKTWQSMGFAYFSKCLKTKQWQFLKSVVQFFSCYIKSLIFHLQNVGVDIFLIADDLGYKNREFISPAVFNSIFREEYRTIIKLIQDRNHKVILHSDGYISSMMESIINLGFDAIQSLEPSAGVNIFELFTKFKSQICFIGNVDMNLLVFGSPVEVENYVSRLVREAIESKNHIIVSPTQQISADVKIQNLHAMIQATHEFKV
jgi:hypothetical protein